MNLKAITLLLFLFATSSAWAGEGRAMLEDFFQGLETLRADFQQQVVNEQGKVESEAGGKVYLNLPHQFRWDYKEPYEQLILADGERVWVYDILLEQITVRDQNEAAVNSPIMALADIGLLEQHFQVQELGPKGGFYWLRMYPTGEEHNFEHMDVAVDEEGLKLMVFTDRFGRETRISFTHLEPNVSLDEELFEFTPPAGTDVIGLEPRQ